jgi:hypothetical protein
MNYNSARVKRPAFPTSSSKEPGTPPRPTPKRAAILPSLCNSIHKGKLFAQPIWTGSPSRKHIYSFCSATKQNVDEYGCSDFIDDYNITKTELLAFNPWLTGDCDTALVANLDETATRAVCIGTGTASATLAPSTTVTGSASRITISTEGTQTSVVAGCRRFHTVQKGDDCPSIESDYDITFAEFYAWNPSGRLSE